MDFAVLSTIDGELHVESSDTWGGALAQYLQGEGVEYESMLVCRDEEPSEHWTVDIYAGDTEERAIVTPLDDLEVGRPRSLPHPKNE